MKGTSFISAKGGTGKTTTVLEIAYHLAQKHRVLVIDLDFQSNTTMQLTNKNIPEVGAFEVLTENVPIKSAVVKAHKNWPQNIDLLSASRKLVKVNKALEDLPDRNFVLKEALEKSSGYDYFLIDNSPVILDLKVTNALAASTHVITPVSCDEFDLQSISAVEDYIYLIKKRTNPDLKVIGTLITQFQYGNAKVIKSLVEDLNSFKTPVIPTKIRYTTKVKEAHKEYQSLDKLRPKCKASTDYKNLVYFLKESLA
jgi:chromosome partitioning protein